MSAATIPTTTYIVDSGAGMSGVTSTANLMTATACKVPITPAFGKILCATSDGIIRDNILGQLGVRALHVEGMHQNLLSVNQVCNGGTNGLQQLGIFTSEGCVFFPIEECRDVLRTLSSRSKTFFGLAQWGVYLYSAANQLSSPL